MSKIQKDTTQFFKFMNEIKEASTTMAIPITRGKVAEGNSYFIRVIKHRLVTRET